MKKILLILLIPFVLYPQKTVSPNWVKARILDSLSVERQARAGADNLRLLKADLDDSLTLRGYQTATQVRTIVGDTAGTLRASIATKLDADFSTYDAYTTPTDADILIVQKEGTTDLAKVELANMPMSFEIIQEFTDLERSINENYAGTDDLSNAMSIINAQSILITALFDSVASLRASIGNSVNPFPSKPTDLQVTGVTASSIRITWTNSADAFDSTAIYYRITTTDAEPTVKYQHKDSTGYTITSLSASTGYDIYVRHRNGIVFSEASATVTGLTSASGSPVAGIADYYVDYVSGNDANSGTDTSRAWKHCPGDPSASGIAASTTLVAGDTVMFKGGVEYLGQILMTASGTDGNEIVYIGNGWGDERSTFNLQNTRQYAFRGNVDYIKIEGFNIFNYARGSFVLYPLSGSSYWTIDSCTVAFMDGWTQTNPFLSSEAIYISGVSNFTLQNSEFFASGQDIIEIYGSSSNLYFLNNDFGGINRGDSTGWFSVAIKGKGGRNVVVRGNNFHDAWQYGGDVNPELNHAPAYIHTYGIADGQYTSVDPYNWIIEKNYFYNDRAFNTGTGTGHIEITTDCKKFYVRNNLSVNSIQWWGANILLAGRADSIWIENNTFIDRDYTTSNGALCNLRVYADVGDSIWVNNNIFWNDDSRITSTNIEWKGPLGVSDYNAFFNNSTTNAFIIGSSGRTFTQIQALGLDVNSIFYTTSEITRGYFTDFPFSPANTSSGDYSLSSSAPTFVKTGGLTLTGFTDDFEGTTRTAGWSIGAIEYVP